MKQTVETDIAIIGGGIAGLWLLNRLRQSGFSTILLESATLGGGQTCKAQGIIHGGMKYALQGSVTKAATQISDMPAIWQDCLQGHGEINLANVPVLSQHQYLWSTGSITSKFAGFLAGKTLKSHTEALDKTLFPAIFQHEQFKGHVYSLDEITIDVHSLVKELMLPHRDAIFKMDAMQDDQLTIDENNQLISLQVKSAPMQTLNIRAKKYIFTAGSGNDLLLNKLPISPIAMQRRPLHMVLVKHPIQHPVFAHCLGLGTTPRLTITTHQTQDGQFIWYLGGQIAEVGVKYSSEEQIRIAKKELMELFPWLDFQNAAFASFFVDRAENKEPDGGRPHSCFMKEMGNMIVAWPTKLAFAPELARQVMACLSDQDKTGKVDIRELRGWPIPAIATPIWESLFK